MRYAMAGDESCFCFSCARRFCVTQHAMKAIAASNETVCRVVMTFSFGWDCCFVFRLLTEGFPVTLLPLRDPAAAVPLGRGQPARPRRDIGPRSRPITFPDH